MSQIKFLRTYEYNATSDWITSKLFDSISCDIIVANPASLWNVTSDWLPSGFRLLNAICGKQNTLKGENVKIALE